MAPDELRAASRSAFWRGFWSGAAKAAWLCAVAGLIAAPFFITWGR